MNFEKIRITLTGVNLSRPAELTYKQQSDSAGLI